MSLKRKLHSKQQDRELLREVGLTKLSLKLGVARVARLDWLNGPPSKARSRVVRFIVLLKHADLENKKARVPREEEDEINSILARYRGSRRVYWQPHVGPMEGFWEVNWDRRLRDESYAAETSLITYALSLLQGGSIQLLRTCPACREWFYATRNDRGHCSANCKQKFASNDPGFKQGRREYMKKYRREQKERDKRELQKVLG
jgi:hypothetical protein